jgi:hypothetical protein
LAVVAGYAGLASDEGRVPSAILALAAAAFAAANTFLNCEARRGWNQQRKSAWRGIELDARLILGCEAYQSNDLFYHALRQIAQQQKAAYAGDITRALGVASFRSLPTDNGGARSPPKAPEPTSPVNGLPSTRRQRARPEFVQRVLHASDEEQTLAAITTRRMGRTAAGGPHAAACVVRTRRRGTPYGGRLRRHDHRGRPNSGARHRRRSGCVTDRARPLVTTAHDRLPYSSVGSGRVAASTATSARRSSEPDGSSGTTCSVRTGRAGMPLRCRAPPL